MLTIALLDVPFPEADSAWSTSASVSPPMPRAPAVRKCLRVMPSQCRHGLPKIVSMIDPSLAREDGRPLHYKRRGCRMGVGEWSGWAEDATIGSPNRHWYRHCKRRIRPVPTWPVDTAIGLSFPAILALIVASPNLLEEVQLSLAFVAATNPR